MFNQVVIWGHKLHTHTHSYIHGAFYKAFTHLGYKTIWLDNNDNVDMIDFTNSLFITEGQVDEGIVMRDDCTYLLHNCNGNKYTHGKLFTLQVITKSSLEQYKFEPLPNDYGFYNNDRLIMLCWATDLLPDEINKNIELVRNNKLNVKNELNFVGMPISPWDKVKDWCGRNNIMYRNFGGFGNNVSFDKNMELIQQSIIAPSFQEPWQVEHGYIPCRIFKNISYGKMGITNNPFVNEIFDYRLIYGINIDETLDKAKEFNDTDSVIELMEYVRDHHTYINRINSILWFIENSK